MLGVSRGARDLLFTSLTPTNTSPGIDRSPFPPPVTVLRHLFFSASALRLRNVGAARKAPLPITEEPGVEATPEPRAARTRRPPKARPAKKRGTKLIFSNSTSDQLLNVANALAEE